MEALQIISVSWPLAAMFGAFCVSGTLMYLIRSHRKDRQEALLMASSTAREIAPIPRFKEPE